MMQIHDAAARSTALEPNRSFIVQAPAGSGKTELLTQRYLMLLAQVKAPEEIIAITFTRKAAAEMRARILKALGSARGDKPSEAHKLTTWQLASAALANDDVQQWHLQRNPNRLRIQTFDSLAAELTRQMPVLSTTGAQPGVTENAGPLYEEAAKATLSSLDDPDTGIHIQGVLSHLDNRWSLASELLVSMLARRDQWLNILAPDNILSIENTLEDVLNSKLSTLHSLVDAHDLDALCVLTHFAANNLNDPSSPQHAFINNAALPEASRSDLAKWCGIAEMVLTKNGTARKKGGINVKMGFPPDKKQEKEELVAVIDKLASDTALLERLDEVRCMPKDNYKDDQTAILIDLLHCLNFAVRKLQDVFAQHHEGDEESPTDLALSLDYQIQHLLIDEFQDTSTSQYHLIKQLTAGWPPNDGRTLFIVGDPMQSIYRFRQAEVGLFLQTQDHGLGDISLDRLTLSMNFRSQGGIIDWVNQTFAKVFPTHDERNEGAVSYSPSDAAHPVSHEISVHTHTFDSAYYAEAEAAFITQQIQSYRDTHPDNSIALLAQSRRHLDLIVESLKFADIPVQANKIEALIHRATVMDLRSLTRALLHPADRLAWLSLLRSPLVGLHIKDIAVIAESHSNDTLYTQMRRDQTRKQLSDDGQQRLAHLETVLSSHLPYRPTRSLRQTLEAIWTLLGGLTLASSTDRQDARDYFDLIESLSDTDGLLDFAQLDNKLTSLYSQTVASDNNPVQLMTMHGAKGLEFDLVILPGLTRQPGQDGHELLVWQQRLDESKSEQLLLAPIAAYESDKEPIANYINSLNKKKDQHEIARLLYVAATRAKDQLILCGKGEIDPKTDALKTPNKNSLMHRLWSSISDTVIHHSEAPEERAQNSSQEQCLSNDWAFTSPEQLTSSTQTSQAQRSDIEWNENAARHIGTLVHRYLERISQEGVEQWPASRIDALAGALRTGLMHLGVSDAELDRSVAQAQRALQQTLNDKTGQWILSSHTEAQSELALSRLADNIEHFIIDRTFVDDGVRWIVDYKTSEDLQNDMPAFLTQEREHYLEQLENYARLVSDFDPRPIKLALYFPLMQHLESWDYAN
jgi:ATP-dependent helicase/nuclease subunit A